MNCCNDAVLFKCAVKYVEDLWKKHCAAQGREGSVRASDGMIWLSIAKYEYETHSAMIASGDAAYMVGYIDGLCAPAIRPTAAKGAKGIKCPGCGMPKDISAKLEDCLKCGYPDPRSDECIECGHTAQMVLNGHPLCLKCGTPVRK